MVESRKFVVDEGGNKRVTISLDDTKQTINDLTQWFKVNAPTYYTTTLEGVSGLKEVDIDIRLQAILSKSESYAALKLLYQAFNGGFQLQDNFRTLSLEEIVEKIKDKRIPIAIDGDSEQVMCIDLSTGDTLMIVEKDDINSVLEDLHTTFGAYLEGIRDKVLSQKLIYEEGLGLVSVQ